jgi:hypothetical protein
MIGGICSCTSSRLLGLGLAPGAVHGSERFGGALLRVGHPAPALVRVVGVTRVVGGRRLHGSTPSTDTCSMRRVT